MQNFPSVGLAEGKFEAFLREAGMDYGRELELAKTARAMDFLVSAVVFTPEQADAMAAAGADMIVFHPGIDADGECRGRAPDAPVRFAEVAAAARKRAPGVIPARMAFGRDGAAVPDGLPHGVQYDRNIG